MNPNEKSERKIYIGTSGFSYQHWGNGVFYPSSLKFSEWLKYYSSHFNTIELNVTFNKLPHKEFFVQWQQEVPKTFRFSIKGNQYITHMKKLAAIAEPLKLFMDRVSKLKENLACIVWEIPSLGNLRIKRFKEFIIHLKKYPKIKNGFDLKDSSNQTKEIYQLIKENEMFFVEKEDFKSENKHSTFRYLKLDEPENPSNLYSKNDLKKLAETIQQLSSKGAEIYLYFGNDIRGNAIQNAKQLIQLTSC